MEWFKELMMSLHRNRLWCTPIPNEGTLNIAYPGQVDVDLRVFNIAGKLVIYQPDQNLNQS